MASFEGERVEHARGALGASVAGSVQAPARGWREGFQGDGCFGNQCASSQWPVGRPRAMGVPSGGAQASVGVRMRIPSRLIFAVPSPCPLLGSRPKDCPEGAVSSNFRGMGSCPVGPGAVAWLLRPALGAGFRIDARENGDGSLLFRVNCKMRHGVGLERASGGRDWHFVTFSCYHRCAYLESPAGAGFV